MRVLIAVVALGVMLALGAVAQAAQITSTVHFSNRSASGDIGLGYYGGGKVNEIGDAYRDFLKWEQLFELCPTNTNVIEATLKLHLKDDSKNDGYEYTTLFSKDGNSWDSLGSFEVDKGIYTFDVTEYLNDGFIWLKLTDDCGDFMIKKSVLDIECTPVPLPGAAWLLGAGMFGVIGVRRRLRAS